MKKSTFLVLFTLVLACCIGVERSAAQCFEKGDKIINAGIKISIYKVSDEGSDNDEEEDGDDGAASYTIPISFEYALTNRIGIGAEIGICNYFTGEDTITGTIASATSFDMLISGNFHWVRAGRADLYSGIGLGFSSFKYESNDARESRFKSTGTYVRLSLFNARFYVGKKFALTLHCGIPYMNFNNGRIDDNIGSDYNYPLTFTGVDIGTGIAFKF